jgi:hypothetical protein
MGAGRGVAVIKNFGTTTNVLTINISGDAKLVLRDFSITANTTSSGSGISITAGNNITVQNVGVALHRTGFAFSASVGSTFRSAFVDSTDDNAAAVGVSLGDRCRLSGCEITSGTTNGTGVSGSGSSCRADESYVIRFATGVTLSGTDARAEGMHVTTSTTAYTLSGTDSNARNCDALSAGTGFNLTGTRANALGCTANTCTTAYSLGVASAATVACNATLCTTGFSVGAFANCRVVSCISTNATTDLSVNASATLLVEHSNVFTTVVDSATTPHSWLTNRAKVAKVTKVTDSTTTPSITPVPQGNDIYVISCTNTGAVTLTINNTSTTGLVDGQLFTVIVQKPATNGITATWGTQYNNNSMPALATSISSQTEAMLMFVWRPASSVWAFLNQVSAASAANW